MQYIAMTRNNLSIIQISLGVVSASLRETVQIEQWIFKVCSQHWCYFNYSIMPLSKIIGVKFRFAKKARKFKTISHMIWCLHKCQVKWEIVSNFCGRTLSCMFSEGTFLSFPFIIGLIHNGVRLLKNNKEIKSKKFAFWFWHFKIVSSTIHSITHNWAT